MSYELAASLGLALMLTALAVWLAVGRYKVFVAGQDAQRDAQAAQRERFSRPKASLDASPVAARPAKPQGFGRR